MSDALEPPSEWVEDDDPSQARHVRFVPAPPDGVGPPSDQPERTPEMVANHQHWAWMNGPGDPHWEVRGTGVIDE